MPWPERALWNSASEEQQKEAHRRCTALLELWLGKATKAEVMERLQIPALRLWQLSQQALAGMVAGLLKQPRRLPPVGELLMPNPENEVRALRRRNAELEKENEEMKQLLSILRELPSNRERAAAIKVPPRLEPKVPILQPLPSSDTSEPNAAVKSPTTPAKRRPGRPKVDRGTDPRRPDQTK
jgi:hypothetical protein